MYIRCLREGNKHNMYSRPSVQNKVSIVTFPMYECNFYVPMTFCSVGVEEFVVSMQDAFKMQVEVSCLVYSQTTLKRRNRQY